MQQKWRGEISERILSLKSFQCKHLSVVCASSQSFQSRGRAGTLTLLRTDARARLSGHSRPIRPSASVYVAQGLSSPKVRYLTPHYAYAGCRVLSCGKLRNLFSTVHSTLYQCREPPPPLFATAHPNGGSKKLYTSVEP